MAKKRSSKKKAASFGLSDQKLYERITESKYIEYDEFYLYPSRMLDYLDEENKLNSEQLDALVLSIIGKLDIPEGLLENMLNEIQSESVFTSEASDDVIKNTKTATEVLVNYLKAQGANELGFYSGRDLILGIITEYFDGTLNQEQFEFVEYGLRVFLRWVKCNWSCVAESFNTLPTFIAALRNKKIKRIRYLLKVFLPFPPYNQKMLSLYNEGARFNKYPTFNKNPITIS